MADIGFWTLVSDFGFWTLVSNYEFETLNSYFEFWILESDFGCRTVEQVGFYASNLYLMKTIFLRCDTWATKTGPPYIRPLHSTSFSLRLQPPRKDWVEVWGTGPCAIITKRN